MRKWLFVLFILIVNMQISLGQQNIMEVKSSGSELFLDHKVAAKESLYSLGRQFNVPPKDLALYNKLTLTTGLSIGQDLKIPLDKANFTNEESVGADEVLVPLYHTLQNQETLYRLSQHFNKVPVDKIKKWNHLESDAINVGTSLIVGFLKVDKNQSILAGQKYNPGIKSPAPKKQEETVIVPKKESPSVVQKEKIIITEKAKKNLPETIIKDEPIVTRPTEKVTVIPDEKVDEPTAIKAEKVIVIPVNPPRINFAGGTFKDSYLKQAHPDANSSMASGGIFKSTSGWQDGKYYCFSDEATAGEVLKITNKESGMSIYAKVLDVIPSIRQNSGLQIIISNAAADELGVGEKFTCEISR